MLRLLQWGPVRWWVCMVSSCRVGCRRCARSVRGCGVVWCSWLCGLLLGVEHVLLGACVEVLRWCSRRWRLHGVKEGLGLLAGV